MACAAMAVGRGILRSFSLVLILYIYLILGGITFKNKRILYTISNLAITFISKELASQRPLFNGICCKGKSIKPLPIVKVLLVGIRLLGIKNEAVILLKLSGDIELNPCPQF